MPVKPIRKPPAVGASRKPVHPRIKTAGQTTGLITAVVVVLTAFGVKLDDATTSALFVIVAAAAPTVAGWARRM